MTQRLFVASDAAARSVGADEVAAALEQHIHQRQMDARVVRTGSRGLFWLEPLVEVDTPGGRMAYGPVTVEDVPALLDAGLAHGGQHALAAGLTAEIPYLRDQTRLTFANCGVIDPLSLDDYLDHGGYLGLTSAAQLAPGAVVDEVIQSGLRGRGGAGFPTGLKWKTVLDQPAQPKFIVCNADEGDSGTFADRMLMEGDPFLIVEGMTIAALAVEATRGYIFIRSEYPDAIAVMRAAIDTARRRGYLGADVAGAGRAFDLEVRAGAGAYISGEETSLLEAIEGKRGLIRPKPPLPAISGLFGQPTVINNVLSFAAASTVLAQGAAAYNELGYGRSRGTLTIQLAGNIKRGGLVEIPFGRSLGEVINDFGGGTASGRPLRAVQVGGPLGAYFPEALLDTPLDYEAFGARQGMLGHGGVVVFDDTVDLSYQARFAMEFCALESCGKCTPCRIGSTRGVEVIDRIRAGQQPERHLDLLRDLCELMADASLCALGGLTPTPVLSALRHFPEDFATPRPLATVA